MDEFESDVVSQFSIPLLYAFLYYFSSLNITVNTYNFQARKEVHFHVKKYIWTSTYYQIEGKDKIFL